MSPDDYRAIEDAMREKWPATIAPQFRSQRRRRWAVTSDTPRPKSHVEVYGLLIRPMTSREIEGLCRLSQQAVSIALRAMQREGLVRSSGIGTKGAPKVWRRVAGGRL